MTTLPDELLRRLAIAAEGVGLAIVEATVDTVADILSLIASIRRAIADELLEVEMLREMVAAQYALEHRTDAERRGLASTLGVADPNTPNGFAELCAAIEDRMREVNSAADERMAELANCEAALDHIESTANDAAHDTSQQ